MNKCLTKDCKYARVYIKSQSYENLFSLSDAMCAGTIFMKLYEPYKKEEPARGRHAYPLQLALEGLTTLALLLLLHRHALGLLLHPA